MCRIRGLKRQACRDQITIQELADHLEHEATREDFAAYFADPCWAMEWTMTHSRESLAPLGEAVREGLKRLGIADPDELRDTLA